MMTGTEIREALDDQSRTQKAWLELRVGGDMYLVKLSEDHAYRIAKYVTSRKMTVDASIDEDGDLVIPVAATSTPIKEG